MQKYKIVVSDLDGTLLNDRKEVSEQNHKAIRALKERGVHFVPSSGRALSEMPDIANDPDIRFISCSNGAVILDKKTGESSKACLSKELSNIVLDALYACDTYLVIHQDGKTYLDSKAQTEENLDYHNVSRYFADAVLEFALSMEDFKTFCYSLDDVEMFSVFFHDDTEMKKCQETLLATGKILAVPTFDHSLEIFSVDAGKGNGVRRLAEMTGVDISEIISVGDSPNDITMIEAAGLGLAMENATPEVKAIADEVICTNEEHAISYIASRYF